MQTDGGPAVEPSPIPDKGPAANKQAGTLALGPSTSAPDGGMELAGAGATANQPSLTGSAPETNSPTEASAAQSPSTSSESATASQPAAPETTSASTVSSDQNQAEQQPAASDTASASTVASNQNQTKQQPAASDTASASTVASNQNQAEQQPVAQTSPPEQASAGTVPAKASSSTVAGASSRRLWIVGGLLLAAVVLIALAILPLLRRGYKFTVPSSRSAANRPPTLRFLKREQRPPTRLVFKATASPADHVRSHLNLKRGILRCPARYRCRKVAVLLIG